MKKLLSILFTFSILSASAQLNSAADLIVFSKKSFSEKSLILKKNGWKKSVTNSEKGIEKLDFEKSFSDGKFELLIRSGTLSSSKTLNSTIIYIPKSKVLDKLLNEFEMKYNFGMLQENVLGYSEKNFSITITVGTDKNGKVLHEIKIMSVK